MAEANVREWCVQCCMSREQRAGYVGGCPLTVPEIACPFYDPPKSPPARCGGSE